MGNGSVPVFIRAIVGLVRTPWVAPFFRMRIVIAVPTGASCVIPYVHLVRLWGFHMSVTKENVAALFVPRVNAESRRAVTAVVGARYNQPLAPSIERIANGNHFGGRHGLRFFAIITKPKFFIADAN